MNKILANFAAVCYTKAMMCLSDFSGKRLCVAISGGVDSTALLHYLKSRQTEQGYILSAVHCEHGIRGEESLEDQRFVQQICKEWGVPLRVFSADCRALAAAQKQSLETAARAFRRACFEEIIAQGQADYIVTAHHLLDEAETVLFRLARGTSLSGVVGMREQDGYLLRPFLRWTKADILAYAAENKLAYRQDSTNLVADATRNKIRLQVLPVLEQAVPGAAVHLAQFAFVARADDDLLYEYARALVTACGESVCVAFSDKKPLFRRACLLALKALGVTRDYTQAHLDAAFDLQASEKGALLCFPCGVVGEKEKDCLRFYLQKNDEKIFTLPACQAFTKNGFDGGRYAVSVENTPPNDEQSEWKTLRIDGDKLNKNAVFRFRQEGDWIRTFGGTKTLKKFLNEKKIDVKARAALPLVADAESGEVYIVCGVEISQLVKVDACTQSVLYILTKEKGDRNK